MARRKYLVNLDAMILRADFAYEAEFDQNFDNITTISPRDFQENALVGPNLRKPDFQRETNHWSPEQVFSLLECFVNGDLIPSVILWRTTSYVFVIDGGHRLSALRAWVEDDYGDGPISLNYFGRNIPDSQKKSAEMTRQLVKKQIGTFQHVVTTLAQRDLKPEDRARLQTVVSRALSIQWVKGTADKAESAFFKINKEGTPLDDIEETLLRTRRKPGSIASRAIIRAGTGHKYWSSFSSQYANAIEEQASTIHSLLFEPESDAPVKTLELPLGGSRGVRTALSTLMDYVQISCRKESNVPWDIKAAPDDEDGTKTLETLKNVMHLTRRITGNERGSLGLHPAVYFYGPTGIHQAAMFMGTALLIKRKLLNNDANFFAKFTAARHCLEDALVEHKGTIARILQMFRSRERVDKYSDFLERLVELCLSKNPGDKVSGEEVLETSGFSGSLLVGKSGGIGREGRNFSDETKSLVFIMKALESAIRCPICGGYLDVSKSVSYDHIVPKRDSGTNCSDNCALVHPYCNDGIKN